MFSDNIYGRCAYVTPNTNGGKIEFNVDLFFKRLLLFEKYTLDSIRLKELPHLTKYIGVKGLQYLLENDGIEIHCQPLTMGQIGQTTAIRSIAEKGALPLFSYNFQTVMIAEYQQYIKHALKELKRIPNITNRQLKSLRRLVKKKLVFFKENTANEIHQSFQDNILNSQLTLNSLKRTLLPNEKREALNIKVCKLNKSDWRVETNLCSLLRINEQSGHKIIENTLLNLAGLEKRIYEMRDFHAISGFKDETEFEMFTERLRPIHEDFCESKLTTNFAKIISIKGLPNFKEIIHKKDFSINKLLKIKNTNECKEFRKWLWSIKNPSDKEVKDRISNLNSRIGNLLATNTGKVARFATTTIAGIAPQLGVPLAAIDTFILDKMFKEDSAISFINRLYPKLYER